MYRRKRACEEPAIFVLCHKITITYCIHIKEIIMKDGYDNF